MEKSFMKKVLVTMVLFCLISGSALAQFSIGPRFGINLASISDDPEWPSGYDEGGLLGFVFGASVEIGIAGPMYIDVQPSYIQKGQEVTGPFIINTNQGQVQVQGTLKNKASYIQFPILAKFKFPAGPVKPYGFLGPNIGINMSATQEFEGGGQSIDQDNENISSIDFGIDFGAGVEFGIAPMMSLLLDVRYSLGLTNLVDQQPQAQQGQQQQEVSAKASGIQIMIGAMFGL
jgi:opacity protein-like surface antigen